MDTKWCPFRAHFKYAKFMAKKVSEGERLNVRMSSTQRQRQAAAALLAAADRSYAAALRSYDLGLRSLLDVVAAQKALAASVENLYSQDEYLRRKHPRSVLCVPIVKQDVAHGDLATALGLPAYTQFEVQKIAGTPCKTRSVCVRRYLVCSKHQT
jgi:hypothetical protein